MWREGHTNDDDDGESEESEPAVLTSVYTPNTYIYITIHVKSALAGNRFVRIVVVAAAAAAAEAHERTNRRARARGHRTKPPREENKNARRELEKRCTDCGDGGERRTRARRRPERPVNQFLERTARRERDQLSLCHTRAPMIH